MGTVNLQFPPATTPQQTRGGQKFVQTSDPNTQQLLQQILNQQRQIALSLALITDTHYEE